MRNNEEHITQQRPAPRAENAQGMVFRPQDPATQTRPRGNPERHEPDIARGIARFESVLGR